MRAKPTDFFKSQVVYFKSPNDEDILTGQIKEVTLDNNPGKYEYFAEIHLIDINDMTSLTLSFDDLYATKGDAIENIGTTKIIDMVIDEDNMFNIKSESEQLRFNTRELLNKIETHYLYVPVGRDISPMKHMKRDLDELEKYIKILDAYSTILRYYTTQSNNHNQASKDRATYAYRSNEAFIDKLSNCDIPYLQNLYEGYVEYSN